LVIRTEVERYKEVVIVFSSFLLLSTQYPFFTTFSNLPPSAHSSPFLHYLLPSSHTTLDSHHVEPSPPRCRCFCPCPRSGADQPWKRRSFRCPWSNNSHEHWTHGHYRRRRCQSRHRRHWFPPWYRFWNHLQCRSYCGSCSGRCIIGLQRSQRSHTYPRSHWS
jgi:hypothetical protein